MIASGKVDLKPLITATFPFDESIQAFERAAEGRPEDVKLQVKLQVSVGAPEYESHGRAPPLLFSTRGAAGILARIRTCRFAG